MAALGLYFFYIIIPRPWLLADSLVIQDWYQYNREGSEKKDESSEEC